ncbi:MAG: ABC transporter permease [Burkholderiales bacterium]|nr:ABC transporter permease [Anaerolineae bacterium]
MVSTAVTNNNKPRAGFFSRIWRNQRDLVVIYGLLVVIIIVSGIVSEPFLRLFNIQRLIAQMTTLALVGIGMSFVLLTGGIDLSVGSVVSLVGTVILAVLNHLPPLLGVAVVEGENPSPIFLLIAILAGLLVGVIVGAINGFAITRFRVSPFMATLATLSIVQGLALIVSVNFVGTATLPREFGEVFTENIGPIPIPLIIIVIATVIAAFILRQTPFGRHIYAVGSNEIATRLSGMATDRIKMSAYVISGLMAALAGVFTTARTLSGNPLIGESIPFEAITAVVLGGVSLFGGRGSIYGTIAGVIIISILGNMLNLLRIPSDYQYIMRGCLLVLAVTIYSRRGRG